MGGIDFVITWVDGNDKRWRAEKAKYIGALTEDDLCKNAEARYREMGLLRYWFRGVEKFAPWVDRIYFVTCGQTPEWLNTTHPKLRLVHHSDYMDEEALPTFNSNAIELGIHRIPGLNEQFVYFNDDMFLTAPVEESDFFRKGLPCDMYEVKPLISYVETDSIDYIRLNDIGILNRQYYGRKSKLYGFWKKHNWKYAIKTNLRNLYSIGWKGYIGISDPHVTVAYRKADFEALWDAEGSLLRETCMHKFRTPYDLSHWAVRYLRLVAGQFCPMDLNRTMHSFLLCDGDPSPCEAIRTQRYKVVCLNDNSRVKDFESFWQGLRNAFEELLPEKSEFEL